MHPTRFAAVLLGLLLAACSSTSRQADRIRPLPGTPPWALPQVVDLIQEPADTPATLCPDDARFYVHVETLSRRESGDQADPLADQLWHLLHESRIPHAWGEDRAAFERIFAGSVAAVEQKIGGRYGMVYFAEPDPDLLQNLVEELNLLVIDTGQIGPFATYITSRSDQRFVMGIGERWLAVAEVQHVAHFRRALSAVAERRAMSKQNDGKQPGAAPLSEDPTFKSLIAELPDDSVSQMFVRDYKNRDRHAMGLTRKGNELVVHYTAWAQKLKELVGGVDHSEGVDFGPIPRDIITAATINVMAPTFTASSKKVVNLLAFPREFEADIQPHLASPLVAFLGQLPAKQVRSATAVPAPAFGMAVKLKNPAAAEMLDGMISTAYRLVHLSELNLLRSMFGGIRKASFGAVRYQVADFGDSISKQVKHPFWSRLMKLPDGAGFNSLSYGRIGDWWVICSQEAFFRQCVAAYGDPAQRITGSQAYAAFGLDQRPELLLSGIMRADAFSAMLSDVMAYWQQREAAAEPKREQPEGKSVERVRIVRHARELDQPLRWIADRFKTRHSYRVQVWRESDECVRGELRIVPDASAYAEAPTD